MKIKGSILLLVAAVADTACAISITTLGSAYTQDFNTLATSGTSSTVPADWAFSESGTSANGTYGTGSGTSTTGNTYSFGTSNDRAFGGLRSGTLIPTIGVHFENLTGGTITSLLIQYTGEQWRFGATGRADQMDFQYSFDATSLTDGTWTDFNALDFTAPSAGSVGSRDGNIATNRVLVTGSIAALSIGNGASFWLRWNDLDAAGADDGLGVDDFSLTADGPLPVVPDNLPFDMAAFALIGILSLAAGLSPKAVRRSAAR